MREPGALGERRERGARRGGPRPPRAGGTPFDASPEDRPDRAPAGGSRGPRGRLRSRARHPHRSARPRPRARPAGRRGGAPRAAVARRRRPARRRRGAPRRRRPVAPPRRVRRRRASRARSPASCSRAPRAPRSAPPRGARSRWGPPLAAIAAAAYPPCFPVVLGARRGRCPRRPAPARRPRDRLRGRAPSRVAAVALAGARVARRGGRRAARRGARARRRRSRSAPRSRRRPRSRATPCSRSRLGVVLAIAGAAAQLDAAWRRRAPREAERLEPPRPEPETRRAAAAGAAGPIRVASESRPPVRGRHARPISPRPERSRLVRGRAEQLEVGDLRLHVLAEPLRELRLDLARPLAGEPEPIAHLLERERLRRLPAGGAGARR